MCGIFCILSCCKQNDQCKDTDYKSIQQCMSSILSLCEENIMRRGPDSFNSKYVSFENGCALLAASVLWLQGTEHIKQPLEFENSYFLYNGDVFGGILNAEMQSIEGDTKPLMHLLTNSESIPLVLAQIHGPYGFIYLTKDKTQLFFGRDVFGRRSLLIGKTKDFIVLTSVANKQFKKLIELPSIGIFCINLNSDYLDVHLFPWKCKNRNFELKLRELETFLGVSITVVDNNVEQQIQKFENPNPQDLLIFERISSYGIKEALSEINCHPVWSKTLERMEALLNVSVEKRIKRQPQFCSSCIKDRSECNHALCGVLFSGGVDCAILALLCDKYMDPRRPIDLFNVAFEKNDSFETPDRLTGLQTLEELRTLCPERKWNFLGIDVSQQELAQERNDHIAGLIYPLNSILDESLGCAFWFASRGKVLDYASPCRVLLVGSAADELFGGYTKHRAALKQNGWEGLSLSLEADWQNISHRNLARDDRIISDHGRQVRTPYLDEDFVEYVRSLNTWQKTCPTENLKQGLGEKILLRALAYKLGLQNAAGLRKRAVQFGSRIANSKENANEVSPRL